MAKYSEIYPPATVAQSSEKLGLFVFPFWDKQTTYLNTHTGAYSARFLNGTVEPRGF